MPNSKLRIAKMPKKMPKKCRKNAEKMPKKMPKLSKLYDPS
jgi:hypothetical protein